MKFPATYANAEQEKILQRLARIEDTLDDDGVFGLEHLFVEIRNILKTHELVAFDPHPFDLTLCGFQHTLDQEGNKYPSQWGNEDYIISYAETSEGDFGFIEAIAGADQWEFPWPKNQSEGVQMLMSMGVKVKKQ